VQRASLVRDALFFFRAHAAHGSGILAILHSFVGDRDLFGSL